jgi:hypothetical protein
MRNLLTTLLLILSTITYGQTLQPIKFNKAYDNIPISKTAVLTLKLKMEKGRMYQVLVLQQGIDVMLVLSDDNGQQILERDSPNGKQGLEIFEYSPAETKTFMLTIKVFDEIGNADKGIISYYIKQYTPKEVALLAKTKQDLLVENNKTVLSLDIDHFWEAFDHLKYCKTKWDSILSFQNIYLDRATNGLIAFVKSRNFSADGFVTTMAQLPRYYESIRPYTFESKKAAPLIEEVAEKVKAIYANYKPFKVCFAIGMHNTGGTVSDNFVLLGTEMITTGKNVDYSELGDGWKPADPHKERDIPLAIKGIVLHECIHTQQNSLLDSNAIGCNQLYYSLREGTANFLGELISGTNNDSKTNRYGNSNENDLWNEFKSTLCYHTAEKWMYNGNTVKDRPADLGYYIGYKIVQAYYNNAKDKQQAVKEILELDDPLTFLRRSGYDRQKKN